MAVSQNTQNGLYAKHADVTEYVKTEADCEAMKDQMRATGQYRRVSSARWNNGTRAAPRYEFKVMGWKA